MSPCFPHKSSTEEAIFWNSKAMKEDKTKLKEFAPEIQSSRCIRISLFKCILSVTSDEIRFFRLRGSGYDDGKSGGSLLAPITLNSVIWLVGSYSWFMKQSLGQ